MKKREKQQWVSEVRRDLVKYVYGSVDACMPPGKPAISEDDPDVTRYGNALIRKFKAAIRKVR